MMPIEYSGVLESLSVKALRLLLEPYGTPYRLRLTKAELIKAVRDINALADPPAGKADGPDNEREQVNHE